MYSLKVIARNISRASKQIRDRYPLSDRWSLRYSTPIEIEEMISVLKGLLDERGYPTRKLSREEALWVLCEATICKLDFNYYASNYARIENWAGRVVPFVPNIAQKIVLDLMIKQEELGFAQLYQLLKARQLGMTTLFQVLLSHRAFFYRNITLITGSAAEAKSRIMVGKLEFIWDQLPWWLRPRRTAYQAGELMEYGDLNSSINVSWGNQKSGIGRGSTANVAHLSELASFIDPATLVDASLMKTMHENPFALLGLESTAEGMGNWWHKTWLKNTKMDAVGLAPVKPVFLPWYCGTDLYPTEAGLRRRPIPANWSESIPEYVSKYALAAESYVSQTPILTKALGADWKMPLVQKWYYHLQYEEHKEMGQLHILFQEMPASAEEAFQNSNPIVFSYETLNEVRIEAGGSIPVGVYQLSGRTISPVYSNYTTQGQAISLSCKKTDGSLIERFSLDPLLLDGWPDHQADGKVYIWEFPLIGETYGVSCDPSEGVEQDSSVVEVIKKATPWHPDEQVAEFASNRVAPHDLWVWIFALAHLYTVKEHSGRWNFPRVVIEINIAAGDSAQTEMLKHGWATFHRRYDATKIGQTSQRPRSMAEEIGWRTTNASRPKVIGWLRKHIRDKMLKVRSPWLATELSTLEYNLDRKRIEASQGNHDDRAMALGIMLASWYDPELYGTTPPAWTGQRQLEDDVAKLQMYMGDRQIGSMPRQFRPVGRKPDSRGIRIA